MSDSSAPPPVAPIVRRAIKYLFHNSLLWVLLVIVGWWLLEFNADPDRVPQEVSGQLPRSIFWLFTVVLGLATANAVVRGLLKRRTGSHREPVQQDLVTGGTSSSRAVSETHPAGGPDLVICCSGGGIKSASFCLGALQRLDEIGEYAKAAQLIGVSGGGYAATAFSLASPEQDGPGPGRVFALRGRALGELRQRTNYLADSRRTVYEFFLSLTFGISVNLIAALTVLFLWVRILAAWLVSAGYVTNSGSSTWALDIVWDWRSLLAPIGVPVILIILTFVVFLIDRVAWPHDIKWSSRAPRGFWSQLPPRLVTVAWYWVLAFPLLILVAGQVAQVDIGDLIPAEVPGWLAGLVTSGLLVGAIRWLKNGLTAPPPSGFWGALVTQIRMNVLPRLLILIGMLVAYLAAAASLSWVLSSPPDSWVHSDMSLVVAGLVVLLFRFAGSANLTSLYPFYRDRLAWAFLYQECRDDPAQHQDDDAAHQKEGQNDQQTEASPAPPEQPTNTTLKTCRHHGNAADTCRERIPPSRLTFESLPPNRPKLVLCATVNVHYDPLPSGRNAAAFIISADQPGLSDRRLHPGKTPSLRSLHQSDGPSKSRAAISRTPGQEHRVARSIKRLFLLRPIKSLWFLGSAMAISGAAVAPMVGRDSRQVGPFRMLLTLANIRLGVWQPNPDWMTAESSPRWLWWANRRFNQATPAHVLIEAMGRLGLGDPNLYLTDGGHYDNLGLVEALRTKPRRVIVLDGSGDPQDKFPTMGRAIATARMDLGVEVSFDPKPLLTSGGRRPPAATVARGFAVWPGQTHTCEIDYVRAVLPRGASWDLRAYAAARDTFPDSADTMEVYGEFDFEAFRQLGYLAAGSLATRKQNSLR